MGWLIALGVIMLLAVLPLGVFVQYNSDGPLVRVVLGPVKITVFPLPKKQKKEKKAKEPTEKEKEAQRKAKEEADLPKPPQPPKQEKTKDEKKEQGGSLLDFLPLVKLAFRFLGDFRRKLRLNELYLRLIMAGGDPANLAINYGRANGALGALMPKLDQWFVIKKRDVEIECDFESSETKVIARLQITITLGRLIALVAVYGFRALKEFLSIKKKRKGGAVK